MVGKLWPQQTCQQNMVLYSYFFNCSVSSKLRAKLMPFSSFQLVHHHQENGIDYPIDMQAIYFCFNGLPKGIHVPNSATVSYAELKVSDLEDLTLH